MRDETKQAFKAMTLQEICEYMNRDYDELLMVCEIDCRKEWTEQGKMPFDEYLKIHMVRVLAHIRSDPNNLTAYFI